MNKQARRGCVWLVVVALLALLCGVILWADFHPAEAVGTWEPSWATLAQDWTPVGNPCWTTDGIQLVMRCQSAGIVSNKTWSRDFAIDAHVSVSATAITGGKYFSGLTVYDAQSNDTVYGELTLANGVPPMDGVLGDNSGTLVDDNFTWYTPIVAGQTYTLDVVWQPSGAWIFSLNGQQVSVQPGDLGHDPSIFLLCASVGENTPDDGSSAECRFSDLSVTGVESGNVYTVWLPHVVGAGQGYP